MSTRKIHNFSSTILINETIEHYGYHPDKYGPSSLKFVLANCRYCGQIAPIRKAFFTKAGSACHKECRLKEQSECGSPFKNKEVQEKARCTNLEKYGHEFASQSKEIGRKISVAKQKIVCPPAFLDLCQHFKSINFDATGSVLIFPDQKYAISCHWNDDLIKPENARFCLKQTKQYRERDIHVFHIFEHQWPARKRQILNFISSSLGLCSNRIMARKCRFDNSRQDQFFEDYHIQGAPNLLVSSFNLTYNGEVVAGMTASHHHRQNGDVSSAVLSRLCFADNCNVPGGASKLFVKFQEWAKSQWFKDIVSWSDSSWTVGQVYGVLGFTLERTYAPDYFYWDTKNRVAISKQSQQKKKTNCPDNMTEKEWCRSRGLFPIWDCGKKKWVFSL